ncbi:uncharacterized protein LOC141914449 isoform X3 [Tubulanus polymorphus]|uniref:uncharacterized protein LOC141901615 isoform X3 n=1 Tax=Tubulanus polymorphus TaxID=672921 RepID=UPI003DA63B5A
MLIVDYFFISPFWRVYILLCNIVAGIIKIFWNWNSFLVLTVWNILYLYLKFIIYIGFVFMFMSNSFEKVVKFLTMDLKQNGIGNQYDSNCDSDKSDLRFQHDHFGDKHQSRRSEDISPSIHLTKRSSNSSGSKNKMDGHSEYNGSQDHLDGKADGHRDEDMKYRNKHQDEDMKHRNKHQDEDMKHRNKHQDEDMKHRNKHQDEDMKHRNKHQDEDMKHRNKHQDEDMKHRNKHQDEDMKHRNKHQDEDMKYRNKHQDEDMKHGNKHQDEDMKHRSRHQDEDMNNRKITNYLSRSYRSPDSFTSTHFEDKTFDTSTSTYAIGPQSIDDYVVIGEEETDFERPRTRPKLKRDDKSSSSDSGTSGFNTYSSVHKPNDRRQKSEKTYHNDTNAMSPTLAVKMASKQTGKEETDVLRDQKRSLQQTRASSLDSHSKTSSAQSSSSSSSNSKGLPPTRSGHIKTEKKKAISFSNDGLPETNEPMLRSPLSPNATRPSVLKNSNSKNVHTVTADIEPVRPSYIDMNHDTCSDTLEHENGMCRLSGISQSPSNISNISGISNLSDLTDSSSPENTSPVYPPNSEHYKPKLLKDVPQIVEPSCSSSSSCSSESTDKKSNGNNTSTNRNRSEHSVAGSYVTNNGNSVYNGRSERSRKNSDSSAPKNTSLNSNTADLEIGSVVEVLENPPRYGVIRWIGCLPEAKDRNKLVAGLEMEEECAACLDGTFNGRRIFSCPSKKGFFVYLNKVRKDPRFQETKNLNGTGEPTFGSEESPDIPGNVSPPTVEKNLPNICGKNKGLQGHHNSCYLDATLFSMFAFTQVFDTILHRPKKATDLDEYEEIQKVLRESIVNPLRKFFYVRADKLLKLRTFLDKLSSVNGMMGEEKDPEEFLNSLLQQTLKADPLIKLSSGQESYFYQLFIEKDEKIVLPTTQQLLNLSFLQSDIKLAEIPSCLILQMPRFGKDYKMYQRIVPSLYLDITDILMNAPRECAVCGCLAECECKQCYNHFSGKTSFCGKCFNLTHSRHAERTKHISRPIIVPETYKDFLNQQKELLGDGNVQIDHEMMELFAVVCIETSHYVAFVKCGPGRKAPWVFFDSMADRMGQEHGYNIPEVQPCQELPEWLADDNHERILSLKEDRQLPSYARRVLCDAYLCMYQSTEVMMYK